MKKLFKAVTFILIVTMGLMLIGCGSNPAPAQKSSAAPAQSSSAAPKEEEKKPVDWPKKAIQVVVPYKAGGDTDFNARAYAKYLEKELGQPVVIVNVDGSGGTLGSRKAKESTPDGYTVLFYHTAMLINEAVGMVDYGFDSFEMGSIAAMNPGVVLAVDKAAKWNTLKDLVEDSKANPGKIKFAADTGGTTYLIALLLKAAGADINIVDAGSSADRTVALKGKKIDVIPNPFGTVKSFLENGDFKALALTVEKRNSKLPKIPTAKEQGYDVALDVPYFFLFPKGTPKEIVGKFNKAVEKIAKTNTDYAADIEKAYSQEPFILSAEESTKYLTAQREVVMKYKKELGAK